MPFFDMPLEQLQAYMPPRTEAADFDSFWQETLSEARNFPLNAIFEPVDVGLTLQEVYDVTYSGFGGQPIKAWLILPRQRSGSVPCVVEYIGYGGGRGFPFDWLLWSSAGYAHFIMDTRGQGSSWSKGDTPDPEPTGSNPHFPGFFTRGILDPKTYYYRRVFTDGIRAVEAAREHSAIASNQIAVTGISQGGGIAIAVAGLDSTINVAMPDVPGLCGIRRAIEIIESSPYNEISNYLKTHRDKIATVFNTLSYFDGINLGIRARASALFSVGLMDETCPPSAVYAAYNYYGGPKEMREWAYNQHEGGGSFQTQEKLRFLRGVFANASAKANSR